MIVKYVKKKLVRVAIENKKCLSLFANADNLSVIIRWLISNTLRNHVFLKSGAYVNRWRIVCTYMCVIWRIQIYNYRAFCLITHVTTLMLRELGTALRNNFFFQVYGPKSPRFIENFSLFIFLYEARSPTNNQFFISRYDFFFSIEWKTVNRPVF